jgi:HAMP domain-containing protein
MNRVNLIVTVTLSAALLLSVAVGWKTARDLKRELSQVTAANETVRASLGDLIHEITLKDKEINRLNQDCEIRKPAGTKGSLLK